jgi:hypothetical protein
MEMEHKPVQFTRLPLSLQVVLLILWGMVRMTILFSAILGLVCVIVGTISLFVEGKFLEMYLGGEAVQTTTQKLRFTAVGAALVISGVAFWWFRKRGHIVVPVMIYVVLMALVLAAGGFSGRSDLISLGW